MLAFIALTQNARAQISNLKTTRIATAKVDINKIPIKKTTAFSLKMPDGKLAPDTMQIEIKYDKIGKTAQKSPIKITVASYNAKMRIIEKKLNLEGLDFSDVAGSNKPLLDFEVPPTQIKTLANEKTIKLYKPTTTAGISTTVKSTVISQASALKNKSVATFKDLTGFTSRIIPGTTTKYIPVAKLTTQLAASYLSNNPFSITKTGNTYTKSILSISKSVQISKSNIQNLQGLTTSNNKIVERNATLPLVSMEGGNDMLFQVNTSGYLHSKTVATPISKPVDQTTFTDLTATQSEFMVSGGVSAGGKLNQTTFNIFDLGITYTAKSNASKKHTRQVSLKIGGQELLGASDLNKSFDGDFAVVTDRFERTLDIPLIATSVPIGIGELSFEAGVTGTSGIAINGEMSRSQAGLLITPFANCGLYAEGAASIGFGEFDIIRPYIRPQLNLVELNLTNYAYAALNWGNNFQAISDVSSVGSVEVLKGYLFGGVEVGYPDVKWCCCVPLTGIHFPCGVSWNYIDFRIELWKSDGLSKIDKIFIDSNPQEIFFDSWQ
jgi:hypothetical protein